MFDIYSNARRVDAGSLVLTVADHGPKDGPVVVLLHGWPDTARLWRHQVPALVEAGFRVLAPDMRGRGTSDRPVDVAGYHVMTAVGDVLALIDDIGAATAHVVAHDWGAAVGWGAAITAPKRVRSLTVLSVGHPNAFRAAGMKQLMRSWYMLLFQFEGIAERWLSNDDWSNFRRFASGHPETEAWIEDLSREGALTASLNWYRANAHPSGLVRRHSPVPPARVPTLGMWSTGDFALTESQMTESGDHVEAEWRYERIEDASHWIPLDAPDRLNRLLVDWLTAH